MTIGGCFEICAKLKEWSEFSACTSVTWGDMDSPFTPLSASIKVIHTNFDVNRTALIWNGTKFGCFFAVGLVWVRSGLADLVGMSLGLRLKKGISFGLRSKEKEKKNESED